MTNENLTHIIARLEKLEKTVFGSDMKERKTSPKISGVKMDIDFSINERAFVKRYATDKSGPKNLHFYLPILRKGG